MAGRKSIPSAARRPPKRTELSGCTLVALARGTGRKIETDGCGTSPRQFLGERPGGLAGQSSRALAKLAAVNVTLVPVASVFPSPDTRPVTNRQQWAVRGSWQTCPNNSPPTSWFGWHSASLRPSSIRLRLSTTGSSLSAGESQGSASTTSSRVSLRIDMLCSAGPSENAGGFAGRESSSSKYAASVKFSFASADIFPSRCSAARTVEARALK